MNNFLKVLMAVMAVLIGLYPAIYFLGDRNIGLLTTKPQELLANIWWNTGFYLHIVPGGIAMLTGWTQFIRKWRDRHLGWHRRVGLVYVVSALIAGIAGFSIAWTATAGWIAQTGFILLGITWVSTTSMAYFAIRNRQTDRHERMMIFSYAACFAAVALRTWLPVLISVFGDFNTAYRMVAWLCWLPNMVVAYLIVRKKGLIAVSQRR